jgi:hypothetical protein
MRLLVLEVGATPTDIQHRTGIYDSTLQDYLKEIKEQVDGNADLEYNYGSVQDSVVVANYTSKPMNKAITHYAIIIGGNKNG